MVLTQREPARLVNSDSADEFTLRLLESADFDQPTARALDDAPARVAALVARDQDQVVATHIRAVSPPCKIRTGRPETLRITRAAGFGLLLGTSLAAAIVGVRHTTAPTSLAPAREAAAPVLSASPRRVHPVTVRELPDPPVLAPSATNSNRTHESKPPRPLNSDLGQELDLLDAAKTSLSAGNPARALSALNDATRLPRRVLVPEAMVLRVKALVALNRTGEARLLVKTFVARAPNSPVNPVLRDLVAPVEKQ